MSSYKALENFNRQGNKDLYDIGLWGIGDRQVPQTSVNYLLVGGTNDKACANCNWFCSPDDCVIVSGNISPSGICDLWHADMPYPVMQVEVTNFPASKDSKGVSDTTASNANTNTTNTPIVEPPKPTFAWVDSEGIGHLEYTPGDTEAIRAALKELNTTSGMSGTERAQARKTLQGAVLFQPPTKSLFEKAKDWLGLSKVEPDLRPFVLTKDVQGNMRFLVHYSNNYYDRDGEVFTESAHKEYVEWADGAKEYPQLWVWHTEGTCIGQCDMVDYNDHIAWASGTIYPECEEIAENIASMDDTGVSHGYYYKQLGDEFIQYRTFEISLLPILSAANMGTGVNFSRIGEKELEAMGLTPVKREYLLKSGYDPKIVDAIAAGAEKQVKALADLGFQYKESSEDTISTGTGSSDALSADAIQKLITDGITAGFATMLAANASATETAEEKAAKELKARTDTITSDLVKSFKEKLDAAVAESIAPRAGGSQVVRPTEATTNIVDNRTKEVRDSNSFFYETFVKPAEGVGVIN